MRQLAEKVLGMTWLKFNLVGLLNTAVDFMLFTMLLLAGVPLLPAQTLAYLGGMLNSFLLNRYWTFQRSAPFTWQQVLRFTLVSGGALLLSLLALVVLERLLPALWSKVIITGMTALLTYAANRYWVFPVKAR